MTQQVDWADARPGDVLFFPPEAGDPIGEWIAEADTGAYSHVGMVVDDHGNVVNAALRGFRLSDPREFDLGGIVVLPIEGIVSGRSGTPYLGRPAVDPTAALTAARRFVEGTKPQDLHRSGYSMSKALLMMAALCAVHSRDDRLKYLTLRAGGLWSVGEEIQRGETPSFICAEFVAQCYGMPFRWSDLEGTLSAGQVPDAPVHESGQPGSTAATGSPGGPAGGVSPAVSLLLSHLGDEAVGLLEEARDVFDHTFQQELALWRVVERLMCEHRRFLGRCLRCAGDLIHSSVSQVVHAANRSDADDPVTLSPTAPATDDPELPFCLVTPRTLSSASWFDWVRPIRFP